MSYKLIDRNGATVAEFPDMQDLGSVLTQANEATAKEIAESVVDVMTARNMLAVTSMSPS